MLAGGWVSCLRAGRVRLLVFALLVLALWWGGGTFLCPAAPCPGLLACLLACSRSGVGLLACARLLRAPPLRAGAYGNGVGQRCPAPMHCWCRFPRCVARGRERGWGCLPGVVNTRTQGEGGVRGGAGVLTRLVRTTYWWREGGGGDRLLSCGAGFRPGNCWPGRGLGCAFLLLVVGLGWW